MKVTFKCRRSGNTVSFTNENDIKQMRTHEGYLEVKDGLLKDEFKENDAKEGVIGNSGESEDAGKAEAQKEVKRRGRPKR